MKKSVLLILPLLINMLVGCDKEEPNMKVFVASDMHILSDELISESNNFYTKKSLTSDGRIQEYDVELLNEFVNQVNSENPDFVFLTGDLTFNGERKSHENVVEILKKVNDDTKILIIPGNHDIYNLNSKGFIDDKVISVEGVTQEEFKDMYKDYGYQDALYYDNASLSYIYELDESTWALMLDTNNTEYNTELSSNIIGGFIELETLNWIKEKLQIAKNNNIKVISATHHNLLVHNEIFKSSYTIYNYEELLSIYREYNVKINFSGHLHIQSIQELDGIFDIASGSMLDYGHRFGKLDIYDNKYRYEAEKLDISTKDFDFEEYSYNTFYNEYYNKSIKSNQRKYGDSAEKITDLLAKINAYYFDGNYKKINRLVRWNKRKIKKIKEEKNQYAKSIIEVENKNQHEIEIAL